MSYPIFSTKFSDSPNLDAFGRLRTSEITTQIDLKQIDDGLPLFIDIYNFSASVVHDLLDASTTITTTDAGDYVIAQTFQRFSYQSGKSQQIFMTFSDFAPVDGVVKRFGYFSSAIDAPFAELLDGLFLESSNGVITANIYKSGTLIEKTAQVAWRLDKMDGTGFSGFNIDWSKSQIFQLDFEWLGTGRVRWCLIVDGLIIPFHTSNHANNIAGVYMTSPNQPLRWEIRQTGATGGSFKYMCSTVGSEGSLNQLGKILCINDNNIPLTADDSALRYCAIAIRLKNTSLASLIDIVNIALFSSANSTIMYELVLNPVISGTVNYATVTNSAVETFIGDVTNTVTGGTILDTGFVEARASDRIDAQNAIRIGTSITGIPDVLALIVRPLSNSATVHRSISWREQI